MPPMLKGSLGIVCINSGPSMAKIKKTVRCFDILLSEQITKQNWKLHSLMSYYVGFQHIIYGIGAVACKYAAFVFGRFYLTLITLNHCVTDHWST
jgi:hypothetical protein